MRYFLYFRKLEYFSKHLYSTLLIDKKRACRHSDELRLTGKAKNDPSLVIEGNKIQFRSEKIQIQIQD